MYHFSKNKKLNKVLNNIFEQEINICETIEESIREIERYIKDFPNKLDYNIYSYGNLFCYIGDIIEIYKDYKSLKNVSFDIIEEIYKRQVGYIARFIVSNKNKILNWG